MLRFFLLHKHYQGETKIIKQKTGIQLQKHFENVGLVVIFPCLLLGLGNILYMHISTRSHLCFFLFFKDFSPSHHSTSSSLTDTLTSLSSSDNDLSSQREWGTPTGRNISSSKVMNRSTTEVSESEAAKEVQQSAADVIYSFDQTSSVKCQTKLRFSPEYCDI